MTRECEAGRPLLALRHDQRTASTAVVFAADDEVADVELRTPDGPVTIAHRSDRPALTVLAGDVDVAEVLARVRRRDGNAFTVRPAGYPAMTVPDSIAGGRPWAVAIDREAGRGSAFDFGSDTPSVETCVGARQLGPRREGPPSASGGALACGALSPGRFFFSVEPTSTYERKPAERTVVLGAAQPPVAAVVVSGPDGGRRLVPTATGQFATIYPPTVKPIDLTVEVHFDDGTSVLFRGRTRGSG